MEVRPEDIIHYLEGKLSSEERESLEAELKTSEKFRQEAEDIAFIWKTSSALKQHDYIDTEKNWNQLAVRIKRDRRRMKIVAFARSAAAILLLPVLILSGMLFGELKNLKDRPAQYLTVTASSGTVSKINLSDGTEVWLNSGSSLYYPDKFKEGNRSVYLSGEAYFKVRSDKSNRFDVLVNDELIVSAFGTEFNINGYTDAQTIDVTLVEGNVEVTDKERKAGRSLHPGEHLTYSKWDRMGVTAKASMIEKTGWKDGKLAFRRAGMEDVTRRLSRHFNVDIRLEGKELYDYIYSATFTTESLPEILQLMERTAPIQYKIIDPEQWPDYSFSKKTVIISMKKGK